MGLVNLKLSGIWSKQIFLEDNVHVELKFNILQSFSCIEQRRSISNFCLTRRVYRWTSTRFAIEKQFRQMEQKSESRWDTNLNYPSVEVDRSDCNLRLVWSLVNEKSNFGSQNPGLDWWKGTTQHMTRFTVRDFFFRIYFNGNSSMAGSFWPCICF